MKRTILCLLLLAVFCGQAQEKRDKGLFQQGKNTFYEKIMSDLGQYYKSRETAEKQGRFALDFSGRSFPTDMKLYTVQWHNPVESQGATNTCWAFSTVSFLESDLYRARKLQIKLSQIFIVYHEYLEKAIRFVERKGDSYFAEGSEGNAVTKIIKKYGIIPYADYSGLLPGQPFHDHRALYDDLNAYLDGVKKAGAWNLDPVLATVRAILGRHIGTPPQTVNWKGKSYTPVAFARDVLQLDPDQYVDILSYLQQPYWQQVEYQVSDNWWHDKSYHNVPLDTWMETLKKIVKAGYTVSIGGDVSEPGYNADLGVSVVPSFDIPREYIDEHARQFRFSNQTTTDDHGIHIVGYTEKDGDMWFLIKDSGSGAFNGPNKGYRCIREDYVKLKWMDFMVHRSAVDDLLRKFTSAK